MASGTYPCTFLRTKVALLTKKVMIDGTSSFMVSSICLATALRLVKSSSLSNCLTRLSNLGLDQCDAFQTAPEIYAESRYALGDARLPQSVAFRGVCSQSVL